MNCCLSHQYLSAIEATETELLKVTSMQACVYAKSSESSQKLSFRSQICKQENAIFLKSPGSFSIQTFY